MKFTDVTLASASQMESDAIITSIATNLELGKRAYRNVCVMFVALVEKLQGEYAAIEALQKASVSASDLTNARTLYRAYQRTKGMFPSSEGFFEVVNYSLAVAINSIITKREDKGKELIAARINTSTGIAEILYIAETGETYAETKAKVEAAKAAKAKAEALGDTKPEAKVEAKPEAKVEAKPETKAEAKVEAKVETKPEVVTLPKAPVDPLKEFVTSVTTVSEIAARLISTGAAEPAKVRDLVAGLLEEIDAAIEAATVATAA
jgi:hypothetical protein